MSDEHLQLLKQVDNSWSLFLDRDGVINDEKHMDYVNKWEEFTFYPGVTEALAILGKRFGRIFVITNQRGIARGRTKLEDLEIIHKNMLAEIEKASGRIDKIYYCADMESSSPNRKPNPGMGFAAKKDFPEIEFSKSVMVGNTITDMEFGRNLGIRINIFLPTTTPLVRVQNPMVDLVFPNLLAVAKAIEENQPKPNWQ